MSEIVDKAKALVSTYEQLLEHTRTERDQLRAELAAAKNRALIAEKQDERSRHLVCLWKDDREAQAKALSAMTAERDRLAADNARLRAAGQELAKQSYHLIPRGFSQTEDEYQCRLCEVTGSHEHGCALGSFELALTATPAQSLAAHDAALLRRLAAHSDPGERADILPWLLAEADRIEKQAAK